MNDLPKMMQALVVEKFGSPLIKCEVPVPTVVPGSVLVKIEATGICHTDLHAAEGDWPVKPKLPFIPGHEGVGYVVAVGQGVKHLKEGDRVGVPWLHTSCGRCEHCFTGWETLCAEQQMTGYTVNGSYAEYTLADAGYVGHLPDKLGFEQAAPILCAGVTVYKGLKETETKPGQWVVISGIGGLGHLAVQYAKAMGMKVVAVDVHEAQLKIAKECGADIAINAKTTDAVAEIKKTIGGAHGALVTAVSPAAIRQGVDFLRPHGTLALVGLPPGDFPLPIFDVVLHRKTIRGSIVGTRMDLQECLDFAGEGTVKAHIHMHKPSEINTIFDQLKKGEVQGRAVMKF